MQHTQHLDGLAADAISGDEWRFRNDPLAGAGDAASAPHFGMLAKVCQRIDDPQHRVDSGDWIVGGDVGLDLVQVTLGAPCVNIT